MKTIRRRRIKKGKTRVVSFPAPFQHKAQQDIIARRLPPTWSHLDVVCFIASTFDTHYSRPSVSHCLT